MMLDLGPDMGEMQAMLCNMRSQLDLHRPDPVLAPLGTLWRPRTASG